VSWRAPFFGVGVLMAIAFVSIATQVARTPAPPRAERIGLLDPLRALGHRGLLAGSIVALLYNFGFFTLLAYTPLPLGLGVHQLGVVFFGWGVFVAIGAIFGAPRLSRHISPVTLMTVAMALIALDLLIIALGIHSKPVMIAAIVASGLVLGTGNALLSTILMRVSHTNASVSASATNFIRFVGGAAAPFLAGKLSERVSIGAPLFVAAGVVVVGAGLLVGARRLLDEPGPAVLTEVAPADAEAVEAELAAAV
jgi:predicted MFS family arabinose efflux permease